MTVGGGFLDAVDALRIHYPTLPLTLGSLWARDTAPDDRDDRRVELVFCEPLSSLGCTRYVLKLPPGSILDERPVKIADWGRLGFSRIDVPVRPSDTLDNLVYIVSVAPLGNEQERRRFGALIRTMFPAAGLRDTLGS